MALSLHHEAEKQEEFTVPYMKNNNNRAYFGQVRSSTSVYVRMGPDSGVLSQLRVTIFPLVSKCYDVFDLQSCVCVCD